jgi:hypothetical protein
VAEASLTVAAIGGSPSDNQGLVMVVGWLFIVVFLLALMTMAIVWVKKNYVTLNAGPDEKPDDRQLLASLTQIKAEISPDVFRALQRTLVSGDANRLRLAGAALQVALERGGDNPGFGNMLLTMGISDASELGPPLLIGAVEIYQKKFGTEHPETATTLAVAALTLARHNFAEAGAYLAQAIQLCEAVHPDSIELVKVRAAYEEYLQRQAASGDVAADQEQPG